MSTAIVYVGDTTAIQSLTQPSKPVPLSPTFWKGHRLILCTMDEPLLTQGMHVVDRMRRNSTLKNMKDYVGDHYPNASYGVYPIEDDSKIAIIIVANKYSPNNYWYGTYPSK